MKSTMFWLGLVIRLLLFAVVPSRVATELFIPFLDKSILHLGMNPWELSAAHSFPYGSVLFGILAPFKYIFYLAFGDFALGSQVLSFIAVKVPVLIFDLAFLGLLMSFPSVDEKKVLFYYWLNPILIFISYVHLQLDLFAMFFLFLSFWPLLSSQQNMKRVFLSALFFSMAVLCKFHVALVIPLFIAYFWNISFRNLALQKMAIWGASVLLLVLIGFLPHLLSENLSNVSLNSPESTRLFSLAWKMSEESILLFGVAIVVVVMARLLLSSRWSPQGLIYAAAVSMGFLLLCTAAMPGWYFWILPFIALFFSQYRSRLSLIYFGLITFYLLNYLPNEFGFQFSSLISALIFTLMQVSLFGILLAIWILAIRFELPMFRRQRPLLIGIAGNSGAGKNSVSQVFFDLFGHQASSVIEGDDYHKWERGNEKWQDYTHLNPRANYLESLARHIFSLLQGQPVYKSHYDHSSGRFTDERMISASKNIIVQGLHTFYPTMLRRMMDIKVFVGPHEALRVFWKLKRDHLERGHNLEKIRQSLALRAEDSTLHIEPQRNFSDWILEYHPYDVDGLKSMVTLLSSEEIKKYVDENQDIKLYQVHYIANDAPIDLLLEELYQIKTLRVSCAPDEKDLNFLRIEVHGEITAEEVRAIAEKAFTNIRHLTRSHMQPQWRSGFDGMNQLFCLSMMERADLRMSFL